MGEGYSRDVLAQAGGCLPVVWKYYRILTSSAGVLVSTLVEHQLCLLPFPSLAI